MQRLTITHNDVGSTDLTANLRVVPGRGWSLKLFGLALVFVEGLRRMLTIARL